MVTALLISMNTYKLTYRVGFSNVANFMMKANSQASAVSQLREYFKQDIQVLHVEEIK